METISTFRKTVNCIFGFRECARLINIANDTNSEIRLLINNKSGTTKSIISLTSLGLINDKSILIQIIGGDQVKAFHLIDELLKKGWTADDNKE